jgi:hypothetical protein
MAAAGYFGKKLKAMKPAAVFITIPFLFTFSACVPVPAQVISTTPAPFSPPGWSNPDGTMLNVTAGADTISLSWTGAPFQDATSIIFGKTFSGDADTIGRCAENWQTCCIQSPDNIALYNGCYTHTWHVPIWFKQPYPGAADFITVPYNSNNCSFYEAVETNGQPQNFYLELIYMNGGTYLRTKFLFTLTPINRPFTPCIVTAPMAPMPAQFNRDKRKHIK